jgi:Transglutaminase-like domain
MKKLKPALRYTPVVSVLPVLMILLFACAPVRVKTYPAGTYPERTYSTKSYEATVSGWKSYEDLVKWMEKVFSLDMERYKKFQGTLPAPRSPEETLRLKSGIYIDAAEFSKRILNRINPSYRAQIVVIMVRPNVLNHYVCSFNKDGKLFVMDYGTPYREVTGFHGPYQSLEEYKRFYEKHHPEKRHVEGIGYLP